MTEDLLVPLQKGAGEFSRSNWYFYSCCQLCSDDVKVLQLRLVPLCRALSGIKMTKTCKRRDRWPFLQLAML